MKYARVQLDGRPRVAAVEVADRGWIPLVAGSAMRQAIAAQLPGRAVTLKWPNDVLVGEKDGGPARKISGILAEVLPSDPMAVVVGAGVNTTMETVDLPVPTATSFADQGVDVDEDRLLADYLEALRDGIAALAVGGHAAVADEIAEHCSTLGEEVSVSLPAPASEAGEPGGDVDTTLRGVAVRLDASGGLVVQSAGVERVVNAGDVVHVR